MTLRTSTPQLFRSIQDHIVANLEEADGEARFVSDVWDRKDLHGGPGGGGETRILNNGKVFEKAGVNFSEVYGLIAPDFAEKLGAVKKETPFFATGVSLVIHPRSPMIPTTHANWRYLEVGDHAWFGGGSDLTPYYFFEEDAVHFHQVLKNTCDAHNPGYYPKFKKWCDEYFYLPHREEKRGIGGIFFDHLGKNDNSDLLENLAFAKDLGFAFTDQYIPLVEKRKLLSYTEKEREFQLIRRGRYVEFNLLYDRGTHFGLQTKGRIESIFMSLPSLVKWEYNFEPEEGSREAELIRVLKETREWV